MPRVVEPLLEVPTSKSPGTVERNDAIVLLPTPVFPKNTVDVNLSSRPLKIIAVSFTNLLAYLTII